MKENQIQFYLSRYRFAATTEDIGQIAPINAPSINPPYAFIKHPKTCPPNERCLYLVYPSHAPSKPRIGTETNIGKKYNRFHICNKWFILFR